jgi:hypothetical protein
MSEMADIERLVANETAVGFDGRDLLAEVEQLARERSFWRNMYIDDVVPDAEQLLALDLEAAGQTNGP